MNKDNFKAVGWDQLQTKNSLTLNGSQHQKNQLRAQSSFKADEDADEDGNLAQPQQSAGGDYQGRVSLNQSAAHAANQEDD